jgi:L-aminopeptidase/D-esterase-like protein
MTRYRDLGLSVGQLPPGRLNAITDVGGVRVGAVTLIEGDGPLVRGKGPIRTGVTVILPSEHIGREVVFAGCHRLNGNGEFTGFEWIRESGMLSTPVAITNTHSVGVVRDALVAHDVAGHEGHDSFWSLPAVGETYDGALNDINGFHVRAEHLDEAIANASGGPVPEGNTGGHTGWLPVAISTKRPWSRRGPPRAPFIGATSITCGATKRAEPATRVTARRASRSATSARATLLTSRSWCRKSATRTARSATVVVVAGCEESSGKV